MNLNVAIVDDHPLVLEGLKSLLCKQFYYVKSIC
mgnify:CR=1 FL=1